jgi:hypothetical protein
MNLTVRKEFSIMLVDRIININKTNFKWALKAHLLDELPDD